MVAVDPWVVNRLWDDYVNHISSVCLTFDQFQAVLETCRVNQEIIDGEVAFITVCFGPDFHLLSMDTGHLITRPMIMRQFAPLLEQYGKVTTTVPKTDVRWARFLRVAGFRVTGEDWCSTRYEMDRVSCRFSFPS